MSQPPTKVGAFFKGGAGCLVVFLGLGLLIVLVGGRVYADLGGLFLLVLGGGSIGLIVRAIYLRGQRDALQPPKDQNPFP
jgi:hypothetical protein